MIGRSNALFLDNVKILEEAADIFTNTAVVLSEADINQSDSRTEDDVARSWNWIKTCEGCCADHLEFSREYHLFWRSLTENNHWMKQKLKSINQSFPARNMTNDRYEGLKLLEEIKESLLEFTRCQCLVTNLYNTSKSILPLQLRHEPLTKPIPARMLCDYDDGKVDLRKDESVTLLSNDTSVWTVRTKDDINAEISSLFLIIPPPCDSATTSAISLNKQLLALWLASASLLGKKIIAFLQLIFKDLNDVDISALKESDTKFRDGVLNLFDMIESYLSPLWRNDPGYNNLEERLGNLRKFLQTNGPDNGTGDDIHVTVILQEDILRLIMLKYKDYLDYCNSFRDDVDDIKSSVHVILPENFDDLRYITYAYYERMLDTDLKNLAKDNSGAEYGYILHETPLEPLSKYTTASVNLTRSEETTETDQIETTVQEDQTTFSIDSILHPISNKWMTLEESIKAKIYDQDLGLYCNPKTGEKMSMSEALNLGRINVSYTSAKRIREETSAVGLITIKTTKETRPYEITKIISPVTEELLSLQEAIDEGFYDEITGEYKTETGEKLSIVNAIDSGCIKVEYRGQGEETPEIVNKTYAVSGVVDQQRKRRISFVDAVRERIVDRESGDYFNNVTQEKIPVSEAIKKGFIKARIVEEGDDKLDIDPENKIVVERIKRVKNKLLGSLKASNAFKVPK